MSWTSLPDALRTADFDDVELVGFGGGGDRQFAVWAHGEYPVAWSRVLDATQRERLRALVSALPAGMSARCHMPPFGLRFGAGPRELRASVCFRCNNAYVGSELTTFDAGSRPAQELLAFLKSLAPAKWPSEE